MHLLVPGAYRRKKTAGFNLDQWVSMHLLVPGAYRHEIIDRNTRDLSRSQCTFWCRVLTDYF